MMVYQIKIFILLSFLFISTTILASESSTSFTIGKYAYDNNTGAYDNNLNLSKTLTIPNVDELEVTIIGKTEKCCQSEQITNKCCDYLAIYDNKDQEIGLFSGEINEQLVVKGSTIKVTFKSDGRTTNEGVMVNISARLPASVFNEIKLKLLEISNQILKRGTQEAYVKLRHNLQSFQSLHAKMVQTQKIDGLVNEVTAELVTIAQTYKEIAARSTDIMAIHQQQFSLLNNLKQQTLYSLEKLDNKKQEYQSLLDQAQNELLQPDKNRLEQQKVQFSIDGYKNIVQTLYAQQDIWNRFYEAQEKLETKLRTHSKKIELLLHILNINAQIYEQSANFALLRKTKVMAFKDITNLHDLTRIVTDIEESEKDIAQWVEKIEQTEL